MCYEVVGSCRCDFLLPRSLIKHMCVCMCLYVCVYVCMSCVGKSVEGEHWRSVGMCQQRRQRSRTTCRLLIAALCFNHREDIPLAVSSSELTRTRLGRCCILLLSSWHLNVWLRYGRQPWEIIIGKLGLKIGWYIMHFSNIWRFVAYFGSLFSPTLSSLMLWNSFTVFSCDQHTIHYSTNIM